MSAVDKWTPGHPSHDRNDYESREYTSGDRNRLAQHLQFIHGNESLPADWRRWPSDHLQCFSAEQCSHTQRFLIEVPTKHGVWGMEICASCGEQVGKECPHVHLTWHNDGQLLICDNCGVDGT
jgi:hypothetical protein